MYFLIWDFLVKENLENEFEKAYGNEGVWTDFFKKGTGYSGTLLIKDLADERKYFTIDRWESKDAYESFKCRNRKEYKKIDNQCEFLTEQEKLIGYFSDL